MARVFYESQLEELKNKMLELTSMVEEVIGGAVDALVKQDVDKAKSIAANDDLIDEKVIQIEQLCYTLLLRQQPMASDLRAVSAALKMITDIERIGDHGSDISELTVLMAGHTYSDEIEKVQLMASEATMMLIGAVDAFAEGDMAKAEKVIARDDVVDDLFLEIKSSIARSIMNGASAEDDSEWYETPDAAPAASGSAASASGSAGATSGSAASASGSAAPGTATGTANSATSGSAALGAATGAANSATSGSAGAKTAALVSAEQALDLLMVAKYLERIGDHATNIAEWVKFSFTGEFIV